MKLVMIVNPESLWTTGVERLLDDASGVDTIVSRLDNEIDLIRSIDNLHPDVVIWDESLHFIHPWVVATLLKNCPELAIVVVGIFENRVQIYYKREITVKQPTDLLAAIREMQ